MVTPTWSWLISRWDLEPSVVLGIVATTTLYFILCGFRPFAKAPRRRTQTTSRQVIVFCSSMAVLAIALLSPLDRLGDDYLFSAHMVQHLLLATVFPPLFLLGIPEPVASRLLRPPTFSFVARILTFPIIAFLLFNGDIFVWHIPVLYDLTLQNAGVHILEHLSFIFFGVMAWCPVLSPIRAMRLSIPGQLLYLFANIFPEMGLGIVFTFTPTVLYSPYAHDPRLWGLSHLTDQKIGGLIMWMPGNGPWIFAFIAILLIWLDRGHSQSEWSQRTPANATSSS